MPLKHLAPLSCSTVLAGIASTVLLACLLGGCPLSGVTSHGQPVTDPALVAAARALHAIEGTDVAIGGWLIDRHRAACGPPPPTETCVRATSALKQHATVYGPRLLEALQAGKLVLQRATRHPASVTHEELTRVLQTAQGTLVHVSTWAQGEGWHPSTPGDK